MSSGKTVRPSRSESRSAARTVSVAVLIALAACGGADASAPPTPAGPTGPITPQNPVLTLSVAGGDAQTAIPGAAVSIAPSVMVKNDQGAAVSGVSVTFEVDSGGGQVTGASQVTGSDGIARITSWVLGRNEAPNVLRVTSGTLAAVRIRAVGVFPPASGGGKLLGSGSIPLSGGTLTAPGPDSTVRGISITAPSGTLGIPFALTIVGGAPANFKGKSEIASITPLIGIRSSTAALLSKPLKITIRARIPANTFPVITLVDTSTGLRAMLPTVDYTDSSVTAYAVHLDNRKVSTPFNPPGAQQAALSSNVRTFSGFSGLRSSVQLDPPDDEVERSDDAQTTMLIDAIPTELLNRDIDTGFRPSKHGWEWAPVMTSIGATQWGATFTALWRYAYDPQNTLFGLYQKAKGVPESNRQGIRWSAVAQQRINLQYARGIGNDDGFKAAAWDKNINNILRAAMVRAIRPEPQLVVLSNSGAANPGAEDRGFDAGVYAVVAYRIAGDNVYIYDAAAPGDDGRRLVFGSEGMLPFFPGQQNAIGYDKPIAGNTQALVPLSRLATDYYLMLKDEVGLDRFASSTPAVRVGTVRDTVWAADTTRLWFRCALCTRGVQATGTPPLQGPLVAANIFTATAPNTWTSANGGLVGNGVLLSSTAGDRTYGFVHILPNAQGKLGWHDWSTLVARRIPADISASATDPAVGANVTLTMTVDQAKLPSNYTVEWLYGDDLLDEVVKNSLTTKHKWATPGTFEVTARVIHPGNGQIMALARTTIRVAEVFPVWKFTTVTVSVANTTPTPVGTGTGLIGSFNYYQKMYTDIASKKYDGGFLYLPRDTTFQGSLKSRGIYTIDGVNLTLANVMLKGQFPGVGTLYNIGGSIELRANWIAPFVSSPRRVDAADAAEYFTLGGSFNSGSLSGRGWEWFSNYGGTQGITYFPTFTRELVANFSGDNATGTITYVVRNIEPDKFLPSPETRRWTITVNFTAERLK